MVASAQCISSSLQRDPRVLFCDMSAWPSRETPTFIRIRRLLAGLGRPRFRRMGRACSDPDMSDTDTTMATTGPALSRAALLLSLARLVASFAVTDSSSSGAFVVSDLVGLTSYHQPVSSSDLHRVCFLSRRSMSFTSTYSSSPTPCSSESDVLGESDTWNVVLDLAFHGPRLSQGRVNSRCPWRWYIGHESRPIAPDDGQGLDLDVMELFFFSWRRSLTGPHSCCSFLGQTPGTLCWR